MPVLPVYNIVQEGGDASITARAFGRKMIAQIAAGALTVNKLYRELPDGTVLIAQRAGEQYRLTIISQTGAPQEAQSEANIWIPRGFVVYPASDTAPLGWGLPIQQDGSATQFAKANRAPGLDITRWTRGGALGQVLLTRVPKAGYPSATTRLAPMYFSTTSGAQPRRLAKSPVLDTWLDSFVGNSWSAYRLELTSYNVVASTKAAAFAQAAFTLTNQHRSDIGRDPVNLPLRGYYSASQAHAEIEATNGYLAHFSQYFPKTYRTPGDRVFKDGVTYPITGNDGDDRNKTQYVGENAIGSAIGFTLIGSDPNGFPIMRQQGVGFPISPTQAFNGWMASPPHKANIESTDWDGGSTFLDIGYGGNYATQDYTRREQWIGCGNGCWISEDPEIPPLSWHSFHTLNLAWETWPISYSNTGSLDPAAVIHPGTLVQEDGSFWLSYAYSSKGYTHDFAAPALSSQIFLRGRALAIAPHGGLVWAAAIQKITSNISTVSTKYRLVALVHHDSEQPTDKVTNGMTSVLHVWYVDLPDVRGFAANPQSVVRGVRGHAVGADTWPWIDDGDPWSWMDGGMIDMASDVTIITGPCMLKYASRWQFSADGEHAICLRDFGTAENVAAVLATTGLLVTDGLQALTVQLDIPKPLSSAYLSGDPPPAPQITRTVHPLVDSAGITTPFAHPPYGEWSAEGASWAMAPYAVDFDPKNNPRYFYVGTFTDTGVSPSPTLQLAGVGNRQAMTPSDLSNIVVLGGANQSPDTPVPFEYHVLSVADAALVVEGSRTRFYYDRAAHSFPANPSYVPCWSDTAAPVHHVAVYRGGDQLDAQWYGNPGGVFLFLHDLCIVSIFGDNALATILPASVSRSVQASYAKSRDGAWVLSHQACPQIIVARKYSSGVMVACNASFGGACKPTVWDYANVTAAGAPTTATTPLVPADIAPRGGWCTSSFGDQAALAALTKTPGANLRFMTARTV